MIKNRADASVLRNSTYYGSSMKPSGGTQQSSIRGGSPYPLPFYMQFLTEMVPFHIPSLEHCIPFN